MTAPSGAHYELKFSADGSTLSGTRQGVDGTSSEGTIQTEFKRIKR